MNEFDDLFTMQRPATTTRCAVDQGGATNSLASAVERSAGKEVESIVGSSARTCVSRRPTDRTRTWETSSARTTPRYRLAVIVAVGQRLPIERIRNADSPESGATARRLT